MARCDFLRPPLLAFHILYYLRHHHQRLARHAPHYFSQKISCPLAIFASALLFLLRRRFPISLISGFYFYLMMRRSRCHGRKHFVAMHAMLFSARASRKVASSRRPRRRHYIHAAFQIAAEYGDAYFSGRRPTAGQEAITSFLQQSADMPVIFPAWACHAARISFHIEQLPALLFDDGVLRVGKPATTRSTTLMPSSRSASRFRLLDCSRRNDDIPSLYESKCTELYHYGHATSDAPINTADAAGGR